MALRLGSPVTWPLLQVRAKQDSFSIGSTMTPSASVSADSALFVILVCIFAIFLLSGMDVVMKSLVLAVGVYNTMLWRSLIDWSIAYEDGHLKPDLKP